MSEPLRPEDEREDTARFHGEDMSSGAGEAVGHMLWKLYALGRLTAAGMLTCYAIALVIADLYLGATDSGWWAIIPFLVAKIGFSWFTEEEPGEAEPGPPNLGVLALLTAASGLCQLGAAAGFHTTALSFGAEERASDIARWLLISGLACVIVGIAVTIGYAVHTRPRSPDAPPTSDPPTGA